jgi:hypothetical protein
MFVPNMAALAFADLMEAEAERWAALPAEMRDALLSHESEITAEQERRRCD